MRSNKIYWLIGLIPFFSYGQDDTLVLKNERQVVSIVERFNEITNGKKKEKVDSKVEINKSNAETNDLSQDPKFLAYIEDSIRQLNERINEADRKYLIARYGIVQNAKVDPAEAYQDLTTNTYIKRKVADGGGVQIYFDFGVAFTDFSVYESISTVVDAWKQNPQLVIEVRGYADTYGSSQYNKNLSLARAQAVKIYLIEKMGVPSKSISIVGLGEDAPDRIKDPEIDFLNRRAVVRIK